MPFWDETAFYQFTTQQIDEDIVAPAEEIENLCFEVIARAMEDETVLQRLGVAREHWDLIADSWQNKERNLYGRMDFSYDGKVPAKLLEYNADTPTTLYESAVFQWEWLEEADKEGLLPDRCDQFNEVHEKIVEAFPHLGIDSILHLASNQDVEDDKGTLEYIAECAQEAGLLTNVLAMEDIGISEEGQFTDLDDKPISTLFKLYPWEWILAEEFGAMFAQAVSGLSNPPGAQSCRIKDCCRSCGRCLKGTRICCQLFSKMTRRRMRLVKPMFANLLLGRQGANVEIYRDGEIETSREGPLWRAKPYPAGISSTA